MILSPLTPSFYSAFNATVKAGSSTINITTHSQNITKSEPDLPNPSVIYGENWIVMQNRMVHAISDLELNERRLVLHLSPIVRRSIDKDASCRRFTVNANEFAKDFGFKGNHYYELVRKAALSLQGKSFWTWEFETNKKTRHEARVSWIGKSIYKPRTSDVDIVLMDDVIEMLSVFDRNNPFTKYQKDFIINLNSDALIMLELVASFEFKRSKQQSFTVKYIREKFNRIDSYSDISEFKRNVLDKAIASLKKHTPYVVSYKSESNKGGRAITDFVFKVQCDSDSIKPLSATEKDGLQSGAKKIFKKGLTKKQISKIHKNMKHFVDANQHLVSDKSLDYHQIFETFKPLLEDKSAVNNFFMVDELLSINVELADNKVTGSRLAVEQNQPKEQALPKEQTLPKEQAAASVARKLGFTPFIPTAHQAKMIANNPDFYNLYPMLNKVTGSEAHISYLEFRLIASPTEFHKQPLVAFLT